MSLEMCYRKVTNRMLKGVLKEQDERILNEQGGAVISYVDQKTRKTIRICSDPNNQPPCKYDQVSHCGIRDCSKWYC